MIAMYTYYRIHTTYITSFTNTRISNDLKQKRSYLLDPYFAQSTERTIHGLGNKSVVLLLKVSITTYLAQQSIPCLCITQYKYI